MQATTPPPLTRVSGAATVSLVAALAGPERPARVVHAGRDAVYLADDGGCTGVVSSTAVAVPCAVRTMLGELPAVQPGQPASVGERLIRVAGLEVSVARLVDAAVPRLRRPLDLSWAEPLLAGARAELPAPALEQLARGDATAVTALLGRGSGLTPVGDDVLCGWLAGRHAVGRSGGEVARRALELAPRRTTVLSTTLLRYAARGEVIPQFRALLRARDTGTTSALADLLAVGHTSGAGLALGLTLS